MLLVFLSKRQSNDVNINSVAEKSNIFYFISDSQELILFEAFLMYLLLGQSAHAVIR